MIRLRKILNQASRTYNFTIYFTKKQYCFTLIEVTISFLLLANSNAGKNVSKIITILCRMGHKTSTQSIKTWVFKRQFRTSHGLDHTANAECDPIMGVWE